MERDFASGFWIGFLVATIAGIVVSRMRLTVKKIGMAGKPVPVIQQSKISPWQAFKDSVKALFRLLVWTALLAALLLGAYWIVSQSGAF